MGDENLAEEFLRVGADLIHVLCDLDAARFAAAARVDLRLDDDDGGAQLLCVCDCLVDGERRQTVRHVHAKLAQNLLGLVLMNIHLVNPPLIFVSRSLYNSYLTLL